MEKNQNKKARVQLQQLRNHNSLIELSPVDTLENTQSVLTIINELMIQSTQSDINWPNNTCQGIHNILNCTISALEFEIGEMDK